MCDSRIIVIGEGLEVGNKLLSRIFKEHIRNIITPKNTLEFKSDLAKCLSTEGLKYSDTVKYRLEDDTTITINKNTRLIEQRFIKVKQHISVGVMGVKQGIGTTTQCLSIAKFLNSKDITCCYIEKNNSNIIENLLKSNPKFNAFYYEDYTKMKYEDITIFSSKGTIAELSNYNIHIYDFGSIEQNDDINDFLSKDIKIIIGGVKEWEQIYIQKIFDITKECEDLIFIFNFCDLSQSQYFKNNMGKYKEQTYFTEYTPSMSDTKNNKIYQNIFTPYLQESMLIKRDSKFANLLRKFSKNA